MRKSGYIFKRVTATLLIATMLSGCGSGATRSTEQKKGTEESVTTEVVEDENTTTEVVTEENTTTEAEIQENTATEVVIEEEETTEKATEEATREQATAVDDSKKGNTSDKFLDSIQETKGDSTSSSNSNPDPDFDYKSLGYDTYEDFINYATLCPDENTEKKMAKEIVTKIIKKDMSQFDKVKAINDYMILNVRYDTENYKNNTIPATSYTAFGAMKTGVAVCAGYAKMFKLLCVEAGLEVQYVLGYGSGYHAWNRVKVDGKWYNVDVTWNDPDVERHDNGHYYCGCYQYFLISDEMMNKTHKPYDTSKVCNESLDMRAIEEGCPYSDSRICCDTDAKIETLVRNMVENNQLSVDVAVISKATLKSKVVEVLKKCNIYGSYKIDIDSKYTIYRESTNLYYVTLTIEIAGGTLADLKTKVATSYEMAEEVMSEALKNKDKYSTSGNTYFVLYADDKTAADKKVLANLTRWASYEHNVYISFWIEWEKVSDNINGIKLQFVELNEDTVYEHAYSTDEFKAIVDRMISGGRKGVIIKLYDNLHLFEYGGGELNRTEFVQIYCKEICTKYCLTASVGIFGSSDETVDIVFKDEGHDTEYLSWTELKHPTCSEEGLNVKYCRICGEIGETEPIPTNDEHTYCWDVKGITRVLKCECCSYTGIEEICIGNDIWGYYDEAKASAYVDKINRQRANIIMCETDIYGNPIGVISPPQLAIDAGLTEKAKIRVVQMIFSDFAYESLFENEAYSQAVYYATNKYVRSHTGGADLYDENYNVVGVSCFCVDRDNSGFNFLDQYAFEFGEVIQ